MTERETKALMAYLKLMGAKGASTINLERRKILLEKLIASLGGSHVDGAIYREAVDAVLPSVKREEWSFFLAIAREFYYFWAEDFKAISSLNSNGNFTSEPMPGLARSDDSLKQVWGRLDQEKLEVAESWPLQAYKAALREAGADRAVIETREKLVKLLLIDLRNATEKNNKAYRAAVETSLPLFQLQETRRLYLTVVREFYYFWIGDPDARDRIVLE